MNKRYLWVVEVKIGKEWAVTMRVFVYKDEAEAYIKSFKTARVRKYIPEDK
jgi:hypothetical protein